MIRLTFAAIAVSTACASTPANATGPIVSDAVNLDSTAGVADVPRGPGDGAATLDSDSSQDEPKDANSLADQISAALDSVALDAGCWPRYVPDAQECKVDFYSISWCSGTTPACLGYKAYGVCVDCELQHLGNCGLGTMCSEGSCVAEPPCAPGYLQCIYSTYDCKYPMSYRVCGADGKWSSEKFCAAIGCQEIGCQK